MNRNCICSVVIAAAVIAMPSIVVAQTDTNVSPGANAGANSYPQSPQGMNQPGGLSGSTSSSGAQTNLSGTMRDSLGAPGQTGQQMMDKQFVRTAAENGLADVKIGTLAVEKGGPAVKVLAQKMIDDHIKMGKDMDAIADLIGVMMPRKMTKDAQKEYDTLSGLSGTDFDTEYLVFMTKAHYQDLHAFHMEAAVAAEPELAAEVVKAMGMMHQHLGMIMAVAKDQGIMLPPRPQRPAPTTASK